MSKLPGSTLEYILWSLVPYSEPNLKLAFKPNLFFNDLEKIAMRKRQTVRNGYYKAIKQGLVRLDENKIPRLTHKGQIQLSRFRPQKLPSSQLMVVFDVPEKERNKRWRLRMVLREFKFKQVQKSVWVSDYDCAAYLKEEFRDGGLNDCVIMYEAARVYQPS